jgi:hypothetical protein
LDRKEEGEVTLDWSTNKGEKMKRVRIKIRKILVIKLKILNKNWGESVC